MSNTLYKTLNKVEEIPDGNYTGYIWWSDQEQPVLLKDESADFRPPTDGAFVIEALLYDDEAKRSIKVQHQDKSQITQYDLSDIQKHQTIKHDLIPHRLDDVSKICFDELWFEEADELCEGMTSYQRKFTIFTGLKWKD